MTATEEKRRLRDLLYRPSAHANWTTRPAGPPRIHPHWFDPGPMPVIRPRVVRHGVRTFTDDEVRALRAVYRPHDREYGAGGLAAFYDVPYETMKRAVTGKRYGHLDG